MTATPRRAAARLAEVAAQLEEQLGDPHDPGRVFSYSRCADLDAREQFPVDACAELDRLGLPAFYVPVRDGGALEAYDEALQRLRVVARRDLTVAIGHAKTFLGGACVWVGGSLDQAARLGADVLRGAVVSWALTEREHGSDLLAGGVTARPVPGGYRLDGEKWLINNATRGHLLTVLARTADQPGPRSLSVLLVDKRAVDPAGYVPLPAERLHGIRGADISGIRFTGCTVPADALVGTEGQGLDVVLRALLLTRVMCGGLSLGAADHGLALALEHARSTHRFGRPIVRLPQTRRVLAEAAADVLLTEAFALIAARVVQALPGELVTVSPAAKYLLPTVVQRLLTELGEVLGARSLLADASCQEGRFQKVLRDHRLVGIFDGSTTVNLHALIVQFGFLGGARADRGATVAADTAAVAALGDLAAELPPFAPERLALLPRRGSTLLRALPAAVSALCAGGHDPAPETLAAQLAALNDRVGRVLTRLRECPPAQRDHPPAATFDLAHELAVCLAGAAATHLYAGTRRAFDAGAADQAPPLWHRGLWLEAVLTRLASGPMRGRCAPAAPNPGDVFERLADALDDVDATGGTTSLLPGTAITRGSPR